MSGPSDKPGTSAPQAPAPPPPPELARAHALVERGNFRAARAELARVRATSPGAELLAELARLQARLQPDPRAWMLGALALAFLVWMAAAYIG